jgi:hypothetical protein
VRVQKDVVGVCLFAIALAAAPAGLGTIALLPDAQAAEGPTREAAPPVPPPAPPEVDGVPVRDQTDVFSDRAVRTWALELPPARWTALQEDALAEEYVPAMLRVAGVRVGLVGLRFKGAVGSLESCFQDGRRVCERMPLKISFDEYAPERRFFGLEAINLRPMSRDSSKLRERLAYWLFRRAGIHAPRTAFARLTVNGEDQGLVTLVEQIDGRFTDNQFFFDDGLLYKEAWPTSLDAGYYEQRLRTNRSKPRDHSGILDFAEALRIDDPSERAAALERHTDVDYLLRYLAVDALIGNWDGITAFFCENDASCTNHNFYWYRVAKTGRFWLIPWDLDSALHLHDPLFRVPDWTQTPARCDGPVSVWSGLAVGAPGCDPLLGSLATLGSERYRAALRAVLARAFEPGRLRRTIDAWQELIASEIGSERAVWEAEVEALVASLDRIRRRGAALAQEGSAQPLVLDLERVNDFESVSSIDLWESVEARGNARTRRAHDISSERPLAGAADLRFAFEFRDDSAEPESRWLQWARLKLPLEERSVDLTGIRGLRLKLRGDGPRDLRIDVESRAYAGAPRGVRYGWTVRVSREARDVTLPFDELAVPAWAEPLAKPPSEVLNRVTGISLNPQPRGRLASGYFAPGVADSGLLHVDDIEFVRDAG